MKKILFLMTATFALALFASCSGGSDSAMPFVPVVPVGTGTVSDPYSGKLSVKSFSKYSAIGVAATKSGTSANIAAGVSANTSGNEAKNVHLVGQASNGTVEPLSMQKDGQDSDINERPLQFFKAYKRFVFFMYWPSGFIYHNDYGKLLDYPQNFSIYVYGVGQQYEPMLVLDKSNGKIYAIDNSAYGTDYNAVWNKWNAFSSNNNYPYSVAEGGDRFYICYQTWDNNKSYINYYALKLTDDQLQEIYIVKNADSDLFRDMCVDRFGNLFTNGNNQNIKYYMAIDGNKTKINYADNFHAYSSNRSCYSICYWSDGTFSYNSYDQGKQNLKCREYYSYRAGNEYLDAMHPEPYAPLFMAANGYVYQACNDSNSRDKVYKRFNENGKLEACDWVPTATQEIAFSPNELLVKKDNAEYYFAKSYSDYFNNIFSNSTVTLSNVQLFNSSGQPATVKKYDFDSNSFTSEDVPVIVTPMEMNYCFQQRKTNVIYKVQYTDSSRNQFAITEISFVGFTPDYSYSYNDSRYAATSKHVFFVKDGDLVAINIEDGTKDVSCCKSDAIYGSVSKSAAADKVFFTATSLSSNASISGTIDDNGNVQQNSTNYEIRYLSPIN